MEIRKIRGGPFCQSIRFEKANAVTSNKIDNDIHVTVAVDKNKNGISFGLEERFQAKPADSPGVGNYKVIQCVF